VMKKEGRKEGRKEGEEEEEEEEEEKEGEDQWFCSSLAPSACHFCALKQFVEKRDPHCC
jgi:hypothetical protein